MIPLRKRYVMIRNGSEPIMFDLGLVEKILTKGDLDLPAETISTLICDICSGLDGIDASNWSCWETGSYPEIDFALLLEKMLTHGKTIAQVEDEINFECVQL